MLDGRYGDVRTMGNLKDTLDLLWMVCGPIPLISQIVFAVMITCGAIFFIGVRRNSQLLSVLLPLTFFPLFIGAFQSLLSLSAAVNLLRDAETSSGVMSESVTLMGMALLPLLFGFIASLPGFMVVAAGRAHIVWNATTHQSPSARSRQPPKPRRAGYSGDDEIQDEAEKFLSRLTSTRD
jgi:hypothetical protein